MSLEAALADHTKAVNANTGALATHSALLEKVIAGQTASLETIKGIEGTKPAGRPPGSKTKAKDEPKTDAPKVEAKVEAPTAPKTGPMSPEQDAAVRKLVGDWIGKVNDGTEREARKDAVRAAIKKYGFTKLPDITAEDYDAVCADIEGVIAEVSANESSGDSLLD